ncbi:MAG TPA: nucleoside 2-deoxyribosyltransferase [Methanomicrobiales archaeon]|nr:nucleoside 2-deoxyribosyltransferase [Methanomicrobiales archaeon]
MEKREKQRSKVYLAAPLFSDAERAYNLVLRDLLESHGCRVYLPQETGEGLAGPERDQAIFRSHRKALEGASCVVAICDGVDTDSGTAWEMGFAAAKGIPVIALSTDRRRPWAGKKVNLMIRQSAEVVGTPEEILTALDQGCSSRASRRRPPGSRR